MRVLGAVLVMSVLLAAQTVWRGYPAFEYNDFPIPPDYQEKTEWAFARLMYPNAAFGGGFGRRGRFGGNDWREGGRGVFWTMDYPRSDRHFSVAIRRLTRLHARSVEQPINLDEGYQYNWPWLYGVEVGHWNLTDARRRCCANICCAADSSCATTSTARASGMSSWPACGACFRTARS